MSRSARDAFKIVYTTRGRFRTTRRSIVESLRLARLARELAGAYLEVVEWRGEKRALRLREWSLKC